MKVLNSYNGMIDMMNQGKNAVDILLADSLKELAQTRPIEKITIKEITDKAGVIRPTFYNHFQDKYELLEWIIRNELIAPIQPLLESDLITEAMLLIFTNIEKEKAFYGKVARLEGAVTFDDIAQRCVRELLGTVIEKRGLRIEPKYSWLSSELIASYYAQSMCFAVGQWIKSGMNIPPRELAESYFYILTHSLEDLLA